MRPTWLLVLALIVAVALQAAQASAASEEPEGWDQEHVAKVAAGLAARIHELVADPGLEPKQATAMQQRDHHAAVLTVQEIGKLADDLAAKLQAGQGYEQTHPIFEQIQLVRQDIVVYAGNSWIAPETRERVQGIQKVLTLLTYYYQSR